MIKDRKVLVIDVGGTHIKLLATGRKQERKLVSGPTMIAAEMVRKVKAATKDWQYDVISIGYPGPVIHNRPLQEPHNLGAGWVKFDFHQAFRCPVKIMNDAAMQALELQERAHALPGAGYWS